jgi:hypothetical protein
LVLSPIPHLYDLKYNQTDGRSALFPGDIVSPMGLMLLQGQSCVIYPLLFFMFDLI